MMRYDTVEPNVIDDEMLRKSIEEQGPKGEPGRIAKAEGVEFHEVLQLRLDFRNILKIENLWRFVNLTKLQLDNNIIESVEGLEVLVNLVWLDLSFNNIEFIRGLEKLNKLEDLSLSHNRIAKLENLETLVNLQVFSIGYNQLADLHNLTYLRRFKFLRSANFAGNPFNEKEEYKAFVVAHLPNLEYLDYRLVDATFREQATDKYQISVEEMQHDERAAQRKLDEEEARQTELAKHREAYVENLNGPQLFDALYEEDPEGKKINFMPGVADLLATYKEKMAVICLQIFEYGLTEHTKRQTEIRAFWDCVEEAKRSNKELGTKALEEFNQYKEKVFDQLTHLNDQKAVDNLITEYNNEISTLWDKLMGYEMLVVDQLEEVIKDFERNLSDLVSAFIEQVQAYMAQIRELEAQHHERLMDIASSTLEKVLKNELEDEIPEDLRALLVDKDTIVGAITQSHDVHQLKIDSREDRIVSNVNGMLKTLIESVHQNEEIVRNRQRVTEINRLIDNLREEMESFEFDDDRN